MPAVHVMLRQIGVRYRCDECEQGEMIYVADHGPHVSDLRWPASPPRYKHLCNKCGATKELARTYPGTDLVMEDLPKPLSEITPA